ncbi:MAG: protein kinase domain-containing protein, partial [Gaiellaceae bacterium]
MSSSVPTGTEIGGFRVLELLGTGSSGAVYLAEDVMLERRVALKILGPNFMRDERFRARFLSESRLAASLEHPNIVPIHAAGEANGALYIAMRFVEGRDLRRLLERVGRLAPERAVAIVSQVAAALDAAHAQGLVHRDVKPGNILLSTGGGAEHAYLADFGLAKHASTAMSLTGERAIAGTIDYIAPEQVEGGSIDGRADVYSLGCVLYESLAGTPPFERENELAVIHAHLAVPPPRLTDRRPELPEQLDDVIAGALAKKADDRYPSGGEFAAAARAAVAGLEPGLPPGARAAEPTVRTFLFADVRGYTRFTQERGDEAAGQLAAAFAVLVDEVVREQGGVLQELRGDEALMVFDSARGALRCAVALQRRFAEAEFELGVGMGLDAGEAVPVQGGFRGGALNLAARLCALAGPGEVLASEGVVHLARAVDGVRYGARRLERLKGFDRPVPAIEVVPAEHIERAALRRRLRRARRRVGARPRLLVALVGLLTLITLAVGLVFALTGSDGQRAVEPGVAILDAESGDVVAEIPGKEGREAIYADGSFWILKLEPISFSQIDAESRTVVKEIASPVSDVGYFAVDGNDLWVTDYTGPTLVRVDVRLGREVERFRLSNDGADTSRAVGVVVGAGSVWVTRPDAGEILRLNPRTGVVEHRFTGRFGSFSIAFADGDVWFTSFRGLERIDAATNTIVATAQVPPPIVYVAAGGGFAWTANESTGTVYKVDRTGRIVGSYETGEGARSVSYG